MGQSGRIGPTPSGSLEAPRVPKGILGVFPYIGLLSVRGSLRTPIQGLTIPADPPHRP